jgi:hypothetical protein
MSVYQFQEGHFRSFFVERSFKGLMREFLGRFTPLATRRCRRILEIDIRVVFVFDTASKSWPTELYVRAEYMGNDRKSRRCKCCSSPILVSVKHSGGQTL